MKPNGPQAIRKRKGGNVGKVQPLDILVFQQPALLAKKMIKWLDEPLSPNKILYLLGGDILTS